MRALVKDALELLGPLADERSVALVPAPAVALVPLEEVERRYLARVMDAR